MAAPHDPLEGIVRLVVDGSNLLHALRRGADAPPAATLVGRLRGVVPAPVGIELVFDGPADQGSLGLRVASGVSVRYSGRMPADTLIVRLVTDARATAATGGLTAGATEREVAAAESILVVSDDIELGREIRRRGARTIGSRWLIGQLARTRLVAPMVGGGRPPAPPSTAPQAATGARGEEGWRPGRGATAKRGNPKRTSRKRSHGDIPRR
ncbi:MAG TPA: hypothetical protein VIV06_09570 [Candidatus Limnocylindrales bacterium]